MYVEEEYLEKTAYYETSKTIYWHAIIKILEQIWTTVVE